MLKSAQTVAASRSASFETPGRLHRFGVGRGQLVGTQRQLLEERERRGELRPQRRGSPVGDDRVPDFLTERVRRDRAVGARSERDID